MLEVSQQLKLIEGNNDLDYNKYFYQNKKIKNHYYGIKYNNNKEINKNKNININIKNNIYTPTEENCNLLDNKDSSFNILDNGFMTISCKCNNLLNEKLPTIINRSSNDYQKYMKSDLYKKSSDNTKDVNAYLWYYATNRIKPDDNTKLNTDLFDEKSLKEIKNNPMIKKQLDYLTANILAKNFNVIDDNYNKLNADIGTSFYNTLKKIFLVIAVIFGIFTTISFLITIYKFFNFGDTQINLFYNVNSKYNIPTIISYFIVGFLILFLVFNTRPLITLFDKIYNNNTNNNIIKVGDNKCVNNIDDENNENFINFNNNKNNNNENNIKNNNENNNNENNNLKNKEDFTINGTNCVIDENKQLKCTCDNKTQEKCLRSKYGCCENGDLAIDEDKTNCNNINPKGGYVVLSIFLIILLLISFFVLNLTNKKVISITSFILCIIFTIILFFISFDFINIIDNGLNIIEDPYNACKKIFIYYNKKLNPGLIKTLIIYFITFVVFIGFSVGFLFIKIKMILLNKKKLIFPFGLGQSLIGLLIFIISIFLIFIIYILIVSFPIIFLLVLIVFKFLWEFGMKMRFWIFNINENEYNKIINIYSAIYNSQLSYIDLIFKSKFKNIPGIKNIKTYNMLSPTFTKEHLKNLFENISIIKRNNVTVKRHLFENLELPTSIPWDLPGLKLFKYIMIYFYTTFNKYTVIDDTINSNNYKKIKFFKDNLRFGMDFILDELSKKKVSSSYPSANSQIFSSPFNIIFYILNLFGL